MAANCHQVSPLGNGVNVPIWGYRTFGLSLASTFPLPELWPTPLPPSSAWSEVDAVIRQGLINCPRDIAPGAFHIDFSDGGITLHVASLASFQVRNAREIVVDPAPGVPTSSLRPALLGTVFALLLIYRGLAALHASMVAIDGRAVAFVGDKGAGKSTLAAAFHRHGYDLVADDILAVELSAPELLAQPGFIHMKLWPDAIAALGDDPARYPPQHPEVPKRTMGLDQGVATQPVPLRGIFLLQCGAELAVRRCSPRAAFCELLPHWSGARLSREVLEHLGFQTQFEYCLAIAN